MAVDPDKEFLVAKTVLSKQRTAESVVSNMKSKAQWSRFLVESVVIQDDLEDAVVNDTDEEKPIDPMSPGESLRHFVQRRLVKLHKQSSRQRNTPALSR